MSPDASLLPLIFGSSTHVSSLKSIVLRQDKPLHHTRSEVIA